MRVSEIYNILTKTYEELLMDTLVEMSLDYDISTQSKEISKKLLEKVILEIDFNEVGFSREDFEENKDGLIDLFAEMILEMNEF